MAAFQFGFMALAVDVIDRRAPSKEMHRQLQPKETKVRLYFLPSSVTPTKKIRYTNLNLQTFLHLVIITFNNQVRFHPD